MKASSFFKCAILLPAFVLISIAGNGNNWKSKDTLYLDTLYLDIEYGNAKDPTTNRGIIGGGGYYHATLGIAPTCEIINDSILNIILTKGQMQYRVIEQQDPGGLALLGWSFDLMDAANGPRYVKVVKVVYDNGEDSLVGNGGDYRFIIPEGASKLVRVEINWEWFENKRRFSWSTSSKSAWWWVLFPLPIFGALYYFRRKRKRKKDDNIRWSLSFTGIEPEPVIQDANPLQVIVIRGQIIRSDPSGHTSFPESAEVNLVNTASGETVHVILKPIEAGSSFYISEPIYLNSKEAPMNFEFKTYELMVSVGNLITAILDTCSIFLNIKDANPEPEPLRGFELKNHGKGKITVDPENNIYEQLIVRFTDAENEPVPGERIVWLVETYPESPVSITDENGIAVLNFEPDELGRFTASMDGFPLVEGFHRGLLKICAVPENKLYVDLLDTAALTLEAQLIAPTILQIIDTTYSPVHFIIDGHEYGFRVIPGDRDQAANITKATLNGEFTDVSGDMQEVILTRNVLGYYEMTNFRKISCRINDAEKSVNFRWGTHTLQLTAYPGNIYMSRHTLQKLFECLHQAQNNADLAQGVEGTEEEFEIKANMVKNALAVFTLSRDSTCITVEVATAYVGLLKLPLEELGIVGEYTVEDNVPKVVRDLRLQFRTLKERNVINNAIRQGARSMDNAISEAYFIIVSEAAQLIFAPAFGAYVSISGKTLYGEEASFLERVFGGLMALGSISTIIGPLVSYSRAARAINRVLEFECNFAEKTWEMVLRSKTLRVEALKANEIIAELGEVFKRVKDEIKRVNKSILQAEEKVKVAKAELRAVEEKVAALESAYESKLATSNPMSKHMLSRHRNIHKYKTQTIPGRMHRIAKAEDKLLKARLKAEQYRQELISQETELLRMHEAGVLPYTRQKFGDYSSQWIYQNQNQAGFMRENKLWVGEKSVDVPNRFEVVNWKRFKREDMSVPRPGTRIDHINMDTKTLEIADSKYYVGWPEKEAASMAGFTDEMRIVVEGRANACIDTIEKARVTQYKMLKDLYGTTKGDGAIWKEVFAKPVMIVTSENVPNYFEQLIRGRIMHCGQNLSFVHVPPRLDLWAKTLETIRLGH